MASALAGCARNSRTPATSAPSYSYWIAPPAEGAWRLEVEATFEDAPTERLASPEGGDAVQDVLGVVGATAGTGGTGSPLERDGDGYRDPACRSRCTVRYAIDLATLASSCHRMDCERKIGDAVLGRASSFMLRPEPMGDARFHVRVRGPHADRFVTGLRRDPAGGFVFSASEFGEASFTAFGSMRRGRVDVPGARIDVALLGAPITMGDAATLAFIRDSAARVASLFGRFPVDATLFVVPVPGASDVVFGRVMSLAGGSVALLFGDATPAGAARDNWVVVHELLHLGCPSFVGEGHWLEEGLATYYEPILRARGGWMSEAELWTHFVREMPRGLRQDGARPGLEDRDDIDSTYWGGALFAFLADVRTRAATHGARSLDDAMRAVLAREGDATHVARVADFLETGDEATGARELAAAYESWVVRGDNPDLDALWKTLGIGQVAEARATGSLVTLSDAAPLAAVRRAIAASESH